MHLKWNSRTELRLRGVRSFVRLDTRVRIRYTHLRTDLTPIRFSFVPLGRQLARSVVRTEVSTYVRPSAQASVTTHVWVCTYVGRYRYRSSEHATRSIDDGSMARGGRMSINAGQRSTGSIDPTKRETQGTMAGGGGIDTKRTDPPAGVMEGSAEGSMKPRRPARGRPGAGLLVDHETILLRPSVTDRRTAGHADGRT